MAAEMTGRDGFPCEHDERGLFVLSRDDAQAILDWYEITSECGGIRPDDLALVARIRVWRDRQEEPRA